MRGCSIRIKSALSGAQLNWFSTWIENPYMIEQGANTNSRETPGSHDVGVTIPP